MEAPRTKVVVLCGVSVTMTLLNCRRCDEPTWFTAGAVVCDDCASEFIDLSAGQAERSTVRVSDYNYQGNIPDRTEAAGQPKREEE